jgi:hypothetical protein
MSFGDFPNYRNLGTKTKFERELIITDNGKRSSRLLIESPKNVGVEMKQKFHNEDGDIQVQTRLEETSSHDFDITNKLSVGEGTIETNILRFTPTGEQTEEPKLKIYVPEKPTMPFAYDVPVKRDEQGNLCQRLENTAVITKTEEVHRPDTSSLMNLKYYKWTSALSWWTGLDPVEIRDSGPNDCVIWKTVNNTPVPWAVNYEQLVLYLLAWVQNHDTPPQQN